MGLEALEEESLIGTSCDASDEKRNNPCAIDSTCGLLSPSR